MSAYIVRQRKLRTGNVNFTATTASDADEYLVVVSERCSKETVSELFVTYTPPGDAPNPIPKGTLKQLGSNYLVCDSISVSVASDKTSRIFKVVVTWKEIESSDPQDQTAPTPNSGTTDPNDWTPSWSKRTQVIFEPAFDGFYKGGFPEPSRGDLAMQPFVTAGTRAPIQNSAGERFETNNQIQRRRRIYVWNFRWLRTTIPAGLPEAEGCANNAEFDFVIGSYAFVFEPLTAFIDTIDLSKHRWGNVNLVEISMEIVHDPAGIYWKIRDQGYNRLAQPGLDKDNTGRTLAGLPDERKQIQQIIDANGKPVTEPVDLDGDGKLLLAGGTPVYPIWSDFTEVDFNDVPLLRLL